MPGRCYGLCISVIWFQRHVDERRCILHQLCCRSTSYARLEQSRKGKMAHRLYYDDQHACGNGGSLCYFLGGRKNEKQLSKMDP